MRRPDRITGTARMVLNYLLIGLVGLASASVPSRYGLQQLCAGPTEPPPPAPESIVISKLPLPPKVLNDTEGSCSTAINPRGTGCMLTSGGLQGLQAGNFLPDDNHVIATIRFAGAPAAPDPASIYTGLQIIVVKADGSTFPNGDAWKCLTCGVSEENDHTITTSSRDYSYPQAFADSKRALAGPYIIECDGQNLPSSSCTANRTSIYSIRFGNTTDGSGPGKAIRELRLHPDQVHLGFNSFDYLSGKLGQFAYIGRLVFNPASKTGVPLEPRYDLVDVNVLFDPAAKPPIYANGSELHFNPDAITVGELRGFSGTGREVTYIGHPTESCNIDVYAADLYAGKVRHLASHPGYVDPMQMSPDDGSIVIMDTRGSGRTEFMDRMRGLPPVSDLITTTACSSVRNNGARRFFQPWLLDRHGNRGDYYGQEINSA
ncbi:hypothetical protein CLAFUW4_20065 [Fulvia fulva]|nr:hypothetical protein CLAFUR4_20065 [Fulvia fulva]KAK4620690.1 hypothetical protein CLAFUR0_20065 [Fulvia fulva]WPV17014.1 hypothetical protein CLAFUW4_20065 [Fulvia fulva]WPV32684.1 hypothetical protein CLAFUW7_20065 [Fulvia fulva]